MALADLLRAIEADAAAERARADRETAVEATAIVERARREARALEAELAAAPEAQARAEAERRRALARLDASGAIRSAREDAFASLLTGIRAELAALRGTAAYPELFRALLAESRAALPAARELRVDRRDLDLAMPLAGDLAWIRRSTRGAASSWRATTAGRSGTRSRSVSPTPSCCFAAGSRNGSPRPREPRARRVR